ncbi:extensin-1-like [Vicia villosa]|uniref:extensin-1-like n=1 Tax=Vicia villosa TaxID=3911 RepID=UPI00273BAC0F|nr:extensin-1-like [Vicia villosa]
MKIGNIVPCICEKPPPKFEIIVNMEKFVHVATTCGSQTPPPGQKCGSYTIPSPVQPSPSTPVPPSPPVQPSPPAPVRPSPPIPRSPVPRPPRRSPPPLRRSPPLP